MQGGVYSYGVDAGTGNLLWKKRTYLAADEGGAVVRTQEIALGETPYLNPSEQFAQGAQPEFGGKSGDQILSPTISPLKPQDWFYNIRGQLAASPANSAFGVYIVKKRAAPSGAIVKALRAER